MPVQVEFYGIPRQRAGVAETTAPSGPLAGILQHLGARFPDLAATCFHQDGLAKGFVANVQGDRFVTDPSTELRDGETLMILSADAGG